MSVQRRVLTVLILLLALGAGAAAGQAPDPVYQVSVINALMEGVFESETTFDELARYGDFGLGTFNAVDGEMLALDGIFYQIKDDGLAYEVHGELKTPFSAVTFFKPELLIDIDRPLSQTELEEAILAAMASVNVPYAIKASGEFNYVKVRSVSRQEKPYPRLADVTANQVEFAYEGIRGTIVGFWTPGYMEGVNVPGFHFHFISEDRTLGGHVLALETAAVTVELDEKDEVVVKIPVESQAFRGLDFAKQSLAELEAIEK